MAESIVDCLARAAVSRAAVDAEPLENAKQKHLASAKVWEDMARRARKIAEGRREKELAVQMDHEPAPSPKMRVGKPTER